MCVCAKKSGKSGGKSSSSRNWVEFGESWNFFFVCFPKLFELIEIFAFLCFFFSSSQVLNIRLTFWLSSLVLLVVSREGSKGAEKSFGELKI